MRAADALSPRRHHRTAEFSEIATAMNERCCKGQRCPLDNRHVFRLRRVAEREKQVSKPYFPLFFFALDPRVKSRFVAHTPTKKPNSE